MKPDAKPFMRESCSQRLHVKPRRRQSVPLHMCTEWLYLKVAKWLIFQLRNTNNQIGTESTLVLDDSSVTTYSFKSKTIVKVVQILKEKKYK
ncbi:hypothetical protein ADM90_16325 [Lysinibacillus macroides]|uniref:Uncharacterized protein n=1 Tax=Lysinibacillus macroides TaxID=33935 RepID=A0A0M9DG19_9BACI|nr:hypothetical protein ADM90_16325 [Lysinibacillus macroides]